MVFSIRLCEIFVMFLSQIRVTNGEDTCELEKWVVKRFLFQLVCHLIHPLLKEHFDGFFSFCCIGRQFLVLLIRELEYMTHCAISFCISLFSTCICVSNTTVCLRDVISPFPQSIYDRTVAVKTRFSLSPLTKLLGYANI